MKKDFIKLSGILCAITLIASLLLAGVNYITAPEITKAEEKASLEAMQKILPSADKFEEIEENVFEGTKDGTVVGYCAKVTTTGYGGAIEMMVAFDMNEKVSGIEILSHSETAGLGAKAAESEFKDQFKGKDSALTVTKNGPAGAGQVVAITGATITSKAVAEDGVAKARELVKDKFAQAKEGKVPEAMQKLLPEATEFVEKNDNVYLAMKNDDVIGICTHFALVGQKSGSRTEVVAGYDFEDLVGVELIEHSDGYESYEKLPEDMKTLIVDASDKILIAFIDGEEARANAENN